MQFFDEIPPEAGRERMYARQQDAYEKFQLMNKPETLGKWALVWEGVYRINDSFGHNRTEMDSSFRAFLNSEAKLAGKEVEFSYRYNQKADDPGEVWADVKLFARVIEGGDVS